jgi:hypothetical protein
MKSIKPETNTGPQTEAGFCAQKFPSSTFNIGAQNVIKELVLGSTFQTERR